MKNYEALANDFFHFFYHKGWHGDENTLKRLSVEEAYTVQDIVTQKRIKIGESPAGYKVGCTSPSIRKQFGLNDPIAGRLFYPHIFESKVNIDWSKYLNCAIEPEMVFKIGKTLKGINISDEELIIAIEFVSPGIELHEYHFWVKPPTIQELICSGGIHTGLIIGDQKVSPKDLTFNDEMFSVYMDKSLITSAPSSAIMGSPLHSLRWLVNILTDRGGALENGSLVIPGSPVELVSINQDTLLEINIDRVGSLKANFEKQ